MYLNEAKEHINKVLEDKMPIMLWGAPGIGKSSIVKQICAERNWKLIDLRLSLLNPIDLRGLPYLDSEKKQAVWLSPEFLPKDGVGILFLDEINIAPVATQQAAYELLLDRKIGNYIFPEGWRIITAGNRETDLASVTGMPSPLANRLLHITVEANLDDWKVWAKGNVDERVIGFLNFRPALLAQLPKKEEKAFPTPRSWEFVSRLLRLYSSVEDCEELIKGAVGEGSCKEFLGFVRIYGKLPDVDGILAGTVHDVPEKSDVLYALASALVTKLNKSNLENFLEYSISLPAEFATLAVRDAAKSGWSTDLEKLPSWKKWANKFFKYL